MEVHTCDKCGAKFVPGNRPDGLPNGVAFVLKNGKVVTYCADCIMKFGQEAENGGQA